MKLKLSNYPDYITNRQELQNFLVSKIYEGVKKAGSQENLSLDLGYSLTYITQILKRGKFQALERTYKQMVESKIVE